MIPPQVIEEIRSRSDIIQVISEYVVLKKRGRNFLGLCPFHSEKDASFTVSGEKQLFHCFGCGEGGNAIAFLMKIENINFIEAVAELGAKIGIAVEKGSVSGISKNEKEKLYDILSLANKFFVATLNGESGKTAHEYLKQRQITNTTAKTYSIGAAPESWDSLFKYLIARGGSPKQIELAGLVLPRENNDGYYDRFRSRLIFPVFDLRGRAIAFSGRALDGKEPKYLNSPDTPLYRKGDNLFGLQTAKEFIKREKSVILVEGNLDVLTLFQAGFTNVAAPLGTAMTGAQCKLLSRFAETILLAFDSDSAGETAALRSAELLRSQGLKVKIIENKGAKDPDELIKNHGAEAFEQGLAAALPYLEFKIKGSLAKFNMNEIEDRAKALREVVAILVNEKDGFVQKEYARQASSKLNVDTETLLAEVKRSDFYNQKSGKDSRRFTEKPSSKIVGAEKYLVALAAQNNLTRQKIKGRLTVNDFFSSEAKAIIEILFSLDLPETDNVSHFILEKLDSEAAKGYLTQALLEDNLINEEQLIEDCLKTIKDAHARNRLNEMKTKLFELEKTGESLKAAELIAAIKSEIY